MYGRPKTKPPVAPRRQHLNTAHFFAWCLRGDTRPLDLQKNINKTNKLKQSNQLRGSSRREKKRERERERLKERERDGERERGTERETGSKYRR